MFKSLFFSLLISTVNARDLEVVKSSSGFANSPEYYAIMAKIKTFGEFKKDAAPDAPPAPKPMTRGQQMVEEAKAKNRALIQEQNKKEKELLEKNQGLEGPELWKAQTKEVQEGWKKEVQDQLHQWKMEQEVFLGRLKIYKENTFKLPVKEEKIVEVKVPVERVPDGHIVNGTFSVPMKDQRSRPTCAAFAGIRAIEILLAQNSVEEDLSEQYFYWASKANCQKTPCSQKGSWVTPAYNFSKLAPVVDIPSESECAYKNESITENETQIPLVSSCEKGKVKVKNYEEVKSLSEVVDMLKNDYPVIMAAKLSENFYRNQGLVTLNESTKVGGSMDAHALGHAFLAVGVMELPEKLHKDEGTFCIVIANSWGKGWGAGGYSCLTESWLTKYRQRSPFVVVKTISTK